MKTSKAIRRVTVAGTTGAIGPAIITALVRAGFEVQALNRVASTPPPLPVRIHKVDYTNEHQLSAVLKGQDAVVSCLGDTVPAVASQRALINASIGAGVKRFLPSEFGSDTSNTYVRSLPFFHAKIKHQELLRTAALQHQDFSYTNVTTGLFLDWCLSVVPCIINCGSRSAQVFDDGNIPFSVTRTSVVAEAVSSILRQPEQTKNKTLIIHEFVTTQNELIERVQGLTKHLPPFSRTSIDTLAYEAHAWQAYHKPAGEPLDWIVPFINLSIWSKYMSGCFTHVDNALLGVHELQASSRARVVEAELLEATRKLSSGDLGQEAYDEGKQKLVA